MTQDRYTEIYEAYEQKRRLKILGVAGLVLLLWATFSWGSGRREVILCSNYKTQPEAQKAFIGDTVRYAALDNDGDFLACENLPDK